MREQWQWNHQNSTVKYCFPSRTFSLCPNSRPSFSLSLSIFICTWICFKPCLDIKLYFFWDLKISHAMPVTNWKIVDGVKDLSSNKQTGILNCFLQVLFLGLLWICDGLEIQSWFVSNWCCCYHMGHLCWSHTG